MYDKENHPNLIGHSVNGSKELHSIEDVAKFICENGLHGDVTITYDDNTPFLNTFGIYIDRMLNTCWARLCSVARMPNKTCLVPRIYSSVPPTKETAMQNTPSAKPTLKDCCSYRISPKRYDC